MNYMSGFTTDEQIKVNLILTGSSDVWWRNRQNNTDDVRGRLGTMVSTMSWEFSAGSKMTLSANYTL